MEPSVILLLLISALLAMLWIAKIIFRFRDFKRQLDYLNREIERASDRQLPYWKKKRRRLVWHYLLHPF